MKSKIAVIFTFCTLFLGSYQVQSQIKLSKKKVEKIILGKWVIADIQMPEEVQNGFMKKMFLETFEEFSFDFRKDNSLNAIMRATSVGIDTNLLTTYTVTKNENKYFLEIKRKHKDTIQEIEILGLTKNELILSDLEKDRSFNMVFRREGSDLDKVVDKKIKYNKVQKKVLKQIVGTWKAVETYLDSSSSNSIVQTLDSSISPVFKTITVTFDNNKTVELISTSEKIKPFKEKNNFEISEDGSYLKLMKNEIPSPEKFKIKELTSTKLILEVSSSYERIYFEFKKRK